MFGLNIEHEYYYLLVQIIRIVCICHTTSDTHTQQTPLYSIDIVERKWALHIT